MGQRSEHLDNSSDSKTNMAKLHFFYSVMNAGKTAHLLQVHHNYEMNLGNVLLFTSVTDQRSGTGKVKSRTGLEADAVPLGPSDNVFETVSSKHQQVPVTAVLLDEVQFLSAEQVRQLTRIVDQLGIPVMAYGLKNNAYGELFSEAIATLLALADQINEIKQLCHCGRKATMILKYDGAGKPERSGSVVEMGGEERYVSVCRGHWTSGDIGPLARRRISCLAGL